jgi:hypothetical protein
LWLNSPSPPRPRWVVGYGFLPNFSREYTPLRAVTVRERATKENLAPRCRNLFETDAELVTRYLIFTYSRRGTFREIRAGLQMYYSFTNFRSNFLSSDTFVSYCDIQ